MNASTLTIAEPSRWPHRLAMLLACATFPLIWIGGLVTTYDAGMAVPDWPTTYGYNMFLYPWQTWLTGPWNLFIEHGHRLFASMVGMIAIALVVTCVRREPRAWARRLAWLALAAVIFQGVLGGMRVLMDARLLAKIHGCFGPLFFGLAVALAVVTSRRWRSAATPRPDETGGKLHRLALITTVLAYLQIVLGAQLRHITSQTDPSVFRAFVVMHLIVAALVVLHVALLATLVTRRYRSIAAIARPTWAIALLIVVQVALGAGTWVLKYGPPAWLADYAWAESFVIVERSYGQALVTTAHVAIGSLIFVCSGMVTLWSWRLVGAMRSAPAVGGMAVRAI